MKKLTQQTDLNGLLKQSSRIFSISLLILGLMPLAQATEGNPPPSQVESWDFVLQPQHQQRLNLGDQIYELLFDSLEDLKILDVNIGEGELELEIGRRIFDNQDPLQSFTVVDRVNLMGEIPVFEKVIKNVSGELTSRLRFHVGVDLGAEFLNIRQVLPGQYENLKSANERRKELESSKWYQRVFGKDRESSQSELGQWSVVNDSGRTQLQFIPDPSDPEHRAGLVDFWNLLLFPMRLPLNIESVRKMDDGEVMSYAGHGALEVGAKVGFNWDPTGWSTIGEIGARVKTYVRGIYRFTVLKENNRFVQLKVSRTYAKGSRGALASKIEPLPFEGIFLLEKVHGALEIIPFEVSLSKERAQVFDVQYRYDLNNPHAREAYEKGVLGQLSYSEDLSFDPKGNPTDPTITGVARMLTSTRREYRQNVGQKTEVGFVFKNRRKSQYSKVDTTLTLPDGTHHLFSAIAKNEKSWKAVWGSREKLKYSFGVNLDIERFEQNPSDKLALSLIVDGNISDTMTRTPEFMAYVLEAEDTIGQFGLVPRPPRQNISSRTAGYPIASLENAAPIPLPKGHLGRSTTKYRVTLDRDQIDELIMQNEPERWRSLEKAFGVEENSWATHEDRNKYKALRAPLTLLNVPLFLFDINFRHGSNLLTAEKISEKWVTAQRSLTVRHRAEALAVMFKNHLFAYEMVRLIRNALNGQETGFNIETYSQLFGRSNSRGKTKLRAKDIATETQARLDKGSQESPKASVTDLSVEQWGAKKLRIRFTLSSEPQAVFVQLIEDDSIWFIKNLKGRGDVFLVNDEQFKVGSNEIIIEESEKNPAWNKLAKRLKPSQRYRLNVAINPTGFSWGPPAQVQFKTARKN